MHPLFEGYCSRSFHSALSIDRRAWTTESPRLQSRHFRLRVPASACGIVYPRRLEVSKNNSQQKKERKKEEEHETNKILFTFSYYTREIIVPAWVRQKCLTFCEEFEGVPPELPALCWSLILSSLYICSSLRIASVLTQQFREDVPARRHPARGRSHIRRKSPRRHPWTRAWRSFLQIRPDRAHWH